MEINLWIPEDIDHEELNKRRNQQQITPCMCVSIFFVLADERKSREECLGAGYTELHRECERSRRARSGKRRRWVRGRGVEQLAAARDERRARLGVPLGRADLARVEGHEHLPPLLRHRCVACSPLRSPFAIALCFVWRLQILSVFVRGECTGDSYPTVYCVCVCVS